VLKNANPIMNATNILLVKKQKKTNFFVIMKIRISIHSQKDALKNVQKIKNGILILSVEK